ncbi:MAG: ACP phosphodiesterase [Acidobacteriota bacterium]
MNHLAHVFFAKREPASMIGNLAGNSFKGSVQHHPVPLQESIRVHRHVDAFTDFHPKVLLCRRLLFPGLGHYGGPVLDVFFDHLLARSWDSFSNEPLETFARQAYTLLKKGSALAPWPFSALLPRMLEANFLLRDRSEEGWRSSVRRMSAEFRSPFAASASMDTIDDNRLAIVDAFEEFFPALIEEMHRFNDALEGRASGPDREPLSAAQSPAKTRETD